MTSQIARPSSLNGVIKDAARSRFGIGAREFIRDAIEKLLADELRTADTHLLKLPVRGLDGIDLYLKDESTHPTGSLKHRLARSLFLYGLCNGEIGPGTTIVEASSGSTAISEAYYARMLTLPFVAVVPEGTSPGKLRDIKRQGAEIIFADSADIYHEAARIAEARQGYYMDQFTFAERATDWRGNNNIAESLFQQMEREPHAVPDWIVVGAGTGGTSATIGRYIRYRADTLLKTRLCVADPEGSVFFDSYAGAQTARRCRPSRLEGVGRPRVEPSFLPAVVDRMMRIGDAASIATAYWLTERLGRRVGASTGLNVYASLNLALEMKAAKDAGSIVTLICDGGERYTETIFSDDWIEREQLDLEPWLADLEQF